MSAQVSPAYRELPAGTYQGVRVGEGFAGLERPPHGRRDRHGAGLEHAWQQRHEEASRALTRPAGRQGRR